MKKQFKNSLCALAIIFALTTTSYAQEEGGGDVQDVPTAPISDAIPLALVAATGLGYLVLRKRTVKN